MELELAIKAAGGLDADHGILGGTLPSDRSPLRGNRFPEPSDYRQDRELAEAAHALAGEVGLRQAANRLGIHRDALKAAFGQWRRPALARRVGWQPSRFLADRGEAERAFQLAQHLGSVNAAAQQLGHHLAIAAQSLPATRPRHARPQPQSGPPAGHRRRPPAHRPASHPDPGPGVCGAQPRRAPGPRTVTGRAVPVGPPRRAVRDLGCQRGGRAGQRKPRPPAHTRAWAIIRWADRSHRLAGQRASRSERRQAERADRPGRSQQPQEREMAADAR